MYYELTEGTEIEQVEEIIGQSNGVFGDWIIKEGREPDFISLNVKKRFLICRGYETLLTSLLQHKLIVGVERIDY